MPELPEVETTLRGIKPHVDHAVISDFVVRNPSMRWPVPIHDLQKLIGQTVTLVERRAKYLLIHTDLGVILLHLGMSGSLRILDNKILAEKHDHIDIELNSNTVLRLNDPRRFGCCLFIEPCKQAIEEHNLLATLGPEPLSDEFDTDYLFTLSRKRRVPIKNFIMDGKVVVGVGNIYASEALFLAKIRPTVKANEVSQARYQQLTLTIKQVLRNAIEAGGTTLNDFLQVDGKPGYFKQELQVYARAGEACNLCHKKIKSIMIGQRNTFYCPCCQK